jgi:hypothetical protein
MAFFDFSHFASKPYYITQDTTLEPSRRSIVRPCRLSGLAYEAFLLCANKTLFAGIYARVTVGQSWLVSQMSGTSCAV